MVSHADKAGLLGLDWGSSSLRAFLLGSGGQVLAERSNGHGASTLSGVQAFTDRSRRAHRQATHLRGPVRCCSDWCDVRRLATRW